jgi:leucyl-tRNA synthetase
MEMFGENFESFGQEENEPATPSASKSTTVGKATKGKLQAKSTGYTYQFQIMESIGVPRAEVKKFADPHYWLEYFPPIAIVSPVKLNPPNSNPA